MSDMASVIVPKSDQTNADDFLSGPRTIKITGVTIRGGQEQPISVSYDGDNGKPYKPCKSMCRLMVSAWGADSKQYVGRSMTLYRDATVRWAGLEVGGIRVSHMSDIERPLTVALTMTKQNRKPFTVKPLVTGAKETASPQVAETRETGSEPVMPTTPATDAATISPDESLALEARCTENSIKIPTVKKFFKVERFSQLTAEQLVAAHKMIDGTLAQREQER